MEFCITDELTCRKLIILQSVLGYDTMTDLVTEMLNQEIPVYAERNHLKTVFKKMDGKTTNEDTVLVFNRIRVSSDDCKPYTKAGINKNNIKIGRVAVKTKDLKFLLDNISEIPVNNKKERIDWFESHTGNEYKFLDRLLYNLEQGIFDTALQEYDEYVANVNNIGNIPKQDVPVINNPAKREELGYGPIRRG